jgi:hypothetical protein
VCVQLFDTQGARIGVTRCLGRPLEGPQDILLTVLPSGGFVATWRETVDAGLPVSMPTFRTQMFDRESSRVGDEFVCSFRH